MLLCGSRPINGHELGGIPYLRYNGRICEIKVGLQGEPNLLELFVKLNI